MRRYQHLDKQDMYDALNRLRDAFIAARNREQVDEIINSILNSEEKIKIGRRILIAEALKSGVTFEKIVELMKAGKGTIRAVMKQITTYPRGFELIEKRGSEMEKEYQSKKYRKTGSSILVHKRKEYTGFKRKDIKR